MASNVTSYNFATGHREVSTMPDPQYILMGLYLPDPADSHVATPIHYRAYSNDVRRTDDYRILEDCTESLILHSGEAFGEANHWSKYKSNKPMTLWPAAEIGETVKQVVSKYRQKQGNLFDHRNDTSYKVELAVIGTDTQQTKDTMTSRELGEFIVQSHPAHLTWSECVGVITSTHLDGTQNQFHFDVIPGEDKVLEYPESVVKYHCWRTSWLNEDLAEDPRDWDLIPLPKNWPPSASEMMSGALAPDAGVATGATNSTDTEGGDPASQASQPTLTATDDGKSKKPFLFKRLGWSKGSKTK